MYHRTHNDTHREKGRAFDRERLVGQERYLEDVALRRKTYYRWGQG